MANYNIVFSPTGGTKKVCDMVSSVFSSSPVVIDLLEERSQSFHAGDLCFIAMPSYYGRIPTICHQRMSALQGNGAKAVLIAVFGNRATEDMLLEMYDTAVSCGFVPIAAMEAVAEHSIMHCYGTGRPDEADRRELADFGHIIKNCLPGSLTVSGIPGNRPFKEHKGSHLIPRGDDSCIRCGLCAAQCPAGAIPEDEPSLTDETKCISCMHCISVCPVGSRGNDPQKLAELIERMRPMLSERKKNKLYI